MNCPLCGLIEDTMKLLWCLLVGHKAWNGGVTAYNIIQTFDSEGINLEIKICNRCNLLYSSVKRNPVFYAPVVK